MINHDKIREILWKLIEKGWSIGNLAPYGTQACQFSSTLSGDVNEALAAITSELEKDGPDATEPLKMYRPKDELLGEGCDLTNRESVLCYVADLLDNMVEDSGSFQLARKYCEYIAELEKSAPRWVSVEERLPEEDGSYFIYPEGKYYDHLVEFTVKGFTFDGDTIPPMSFYYVKDDSYGYTYSFKIEPEWWQPLPAPPAKKEEV